MFALLLHPARLVLLVALAIGLGIAVLQLDVAPAGSSAAAALPAAPGPAAAAPAAVPAPAPAPALVVEPPGELVGAAPEPIAAPPAEEERRRGGVACADGHTIVRIDRATVVRAEPGGRRIGSVPATSTYLGQPTIAWVQATTADGRWGQVGLPWSKPVGRTGWISLDGLASGTTTMMLVADLSDRRITAYRACRPIFSVRSAIGRPGSPSPTGRFWVSDRVVVPAAQRDSFGSFAFGLSTVQPNLPPGWSGGDQMAIHGTGAPGSIGEAASAGCLRVSEDALRKLRPLLDPGTPVVIQA